MPPEHRSSSAYELNDHLTPIRHYYLGDASAAAAAAAKVAAQGSRE